VEKLSSEQVQEIFGEVPGVIRSLVEENEALQAKVASFERQAASEKVAHKMIEKGLNNDKPFEVLVDELSKEAEAGRLGEIERAVDMVGPDMGQKIARVSGDGQSSAGSTDFERFIVGGIG
jgi:hypothetical protein